MLAEDKADLSDKPPEASQDKPDLLVQEEADNREQVSLDVPEIPREEQSLPEAEDASLGPEAAQDLGPVPEIQQPAQTPALVDFARPVANPVELPRESIFEDGEPIGLGMPPADARAPMRGLPDERVEIAPAAAVSDPVRPAAAQPVAANVEAPSTQVAASASETGTQPQQKSMRPDGLDLPIWLDADSRPVMPGGAFAGMDLDKAKKVAKDQLPPMDDAGGDWDSDSDGAPVDFKDTRNSQWSPQLAQAYADTGQAHEDYSDELLMYLTRLHDKYQELADAFRRLSNDLDRAGDDR
jgi:hypothetical protein